MKRTSFFILSFLLVTMIGCKTIQPTIGTTTTNQKDSVRIHTEYVHDTTIIEKLRLVTQKPDTIYIQDSVVVTTYKYRYITDTLYQNRYHSDTIQIVEERIVEKPIAPFVRNSCITLWVLVVVAILALIAWVVWKFATGKISWESIISKLIRK